MAGTFFANIPTNTIAIIGILKKPVNWRMIVHNPCGAFINIGEIKKVANAKITPNHWLTLIICLSVALLLISTL